MLNVLASSFKIFSEGIHALAWYWIAWIYLLAFVNGLLPLFFLPRFTAIIVLVSSLTGLAIGLTITHAIGYGKILGLMHFPWIPMVCFQIYVLYNQNFILNTLHDYWLVSSMCISLASLVIDIKDVYEYLRL